MNDFEMKYKGSELEALVEGSASSLFYAGTIEAAYSIPGTNGAQVTVSDAFRTKYNIGENKEVFYIVDKRMIAGDDSNVLYIYPSDYEGCYFVMGDFEGNDAIFSLGATKGDWLVVQGREWVKIITTQREIAGITGEVTTEALVQKLSTPTLENTKPLATKEEILQSDWLARDTASKAFIKNKPFGVIAQTSIQQLNLSADTIGTDISILSETSPFYVAGSVYYAKDVLDQDIVINTAGEALKVRVVKEGNNYYLRHVSGKTQVEDIAFISNVKLKKLSSGYISDEIARTKDFYTKEEVDSKKQDTLSLTVKDNGNIVIGNINGQSKEFMPATPSGDPMHYYYCSQFGVTYNEDTGFFELEYLKDLTANDMRNAVRVSGDTYWLYNDASSVSALVAGEDRPRTNIAMRSGTFQIRDRYDVPRWCRALEQWIIGKSSKSTVATITDVYNGNVGLKLALVGLAELRYIVGVIDISTLISGYLHTLLGDSTTKLQEVRLAKMKMSQTIKIQTELSKDSISYLLSNRINTEEISLSLPAELYNKIMTDGGEWEDLRSLCEATTDKGEVILELNA